MQAWMPGAAKLGLVAGEVDFAATERKVPERQSAILEMPLISPQGRILAVDIDLHDCMDRVPQCAAKD